MSERIQGNRSNFWRMGAVCLFMAAVLAVSPAGAKDKKKGVKEEEKKSEKQVIQNLDQKYRNWFDLVTYIMHPTERKIFIELTNDRDRDIFIDLFWSLRDPTPGTPENEFKDEHIRRFNYANYYFKFGSGRAGWMTDMGRIYILLGEPDSRDRYEVDSIVVPCQIWSYSGKGRPGLPNAFWVVFFQRTEIGEYKVYNPLSDGPYSLLRKTPSTMSIDANDPQAVYEAISQKHDILAMASVSLLPDEPSADYRPTLRSELLLGDIYDLPRRSVNANYATNFLKYKGIVKVDYSMNYIENVNTALVCKDPATGLFFVHFAVLPKAISIEYMKEKDKYYCNFRLDVSLKKGEQTVFSYQKNFPFSYTEESEVQEKLASGVVISDYFPVAYGDYELRVLVQNDVKKDFTYFERRISVKPENQPIPVIFGPLLSYEKKNVPRNAFLPFKMGDLEWTVNPRQEFGTTERIYVLAGLNRCNAVQLAKAVIEVEDLTDVKKFKRDYSFAVPSDQSLLFHVEDIGNLPSGNYRARVRALSENGVTLAVSEATFMVSIQPTIPHPSQAFKIMSADNLFHLYYILGYQYLTQENLDEAQVFFEKAYQIRSSYPNLIKDYCALLLKKKDYERVLAVAEGLKLKNETLFDYYAIRGKTYYYKGSTSEAIENLQKANTIYDSNIEVLNLLGMSYLKGNNKEEAKKVLTASLKVYPDQKDIRELLKKLE